MAPPDSNVAVTVGWCSTWPGPRTSLPCRHWSRLPSTPKTGRPSGVSSAVGRPLISSNAGVCSAWRSPGLTSDRRRPPRGTKSTEALRDRFAPAHRPRFFVAWAGPLAGSFLADAGARVIKVEGGSARRSQIRPGGVLRSPQRRQRDDHDRFRDRSDQALLRRMVAAADLVIEASRPRRWPP